jgi:hypothetical protein
MYRPIASVLNLIAVLKTGTAHAPKLSGSVTKRHGGKQFTRAIKSCVDIHILGINLYWVCAAHLAQLEKTLLVVLTAAHGSGDMPFFNPRFP